MRFSHGGQSCHTPTPHLATERPGGAARLRADLWQWHRARGPHWGRTAHLLTQLQ